MNEIFDDFDALPLKVGLFCRAVVACVVWVAERIW
jgi:hypothetical protein